MSRIIPHLGSAELEARTTAVSAALADFRRWTRGELVPGEWQDWSQRLAADLGGLLEQLAAEDPDQADLDLVLAALRDARAFREGRADAVCDECESEPDGICHDHMAELDQAGRYTDLARRLGGAE